MRIATQCKVIAADILDPDKALCPEILRYDANDPHYLNLLQVYPCTLIHLTM